MKIEQGKYVDYKGYIYEVMGMIKNSETGEDLVIYKRPTDSSVLAMSTALWNALVEYNGKYVKRFIKCSLEKEPEVKNVYSGRKTDYVRLYEIISSVLEEVKPRSLSDEDLKKYFVSRKRDNMNDLTYEYFSSIQDYQFMPNVIGLWKEERIPVFKKILFDYDAKEILNHYNVKTLFETFCEHFPVKNKDSKQNSWLKYAKGVIDVSKFLSRFSSIEEYNEYCSSFDGSLELPKLISDSIHGMGFALACNTLKETGCKDYSKPDVHLKDVLSQTGYCNDDDYSVFNCVKTIAKANNTDPFTVDKKIWLICSGNYYFDKINIESYKESLINRINRG